MPSMARGQGGTWDGWIELEGVAEDVEGDERSSDGGGPGDDCTKTGGNKIRLQLDLRFAPTAR